MIAAYYAYDAIDDRNRAAGGEKAVKPALLMYGCSLSDGWLTCEYMTADRLIEEGVIELHLALSKEQRMTIEVEFDMTARSGLYGDGRFRRVR